MGARDTGWIQIYAENNQEAYDNFVQAYRIAEHKDVRLPIMICQDGFITSHAVENIELLEDDKVKAFVGEYNPEQYLSQNLISSLPFSFCSFNTLYLSAFGTSKIAPRFPDVTIAAYLAR